LAEPELPELAPADAWLAGDEPGEAWAAAA
jgi:hypothetical protein